MPGLQFGNQNVKNIPTKQNVGVSFGTRPTAELMAATPIPARQSIQGRRLASNSVIRPLVGAIDQIEVENV